MCLFLFLQFPPCPYRWVPLAKLINVPDINMVMAPIAAPFVDNHRKQLIAVVTLLSSSLAERKGNLLMTLMQVFMEYLKCQQDTTMITVNEEGRAPVHRMAVG